ncbi:hypothetical protein WICPIJ_008274 [Wickerhamomyces pijperi]|uniref:Secreted protein n=1 Tax=Wickerhamomyces pijperi TaxID=599730 RepID=A0A9P8PZL5_WICPI|nr:hypothetical protein WICPIJ_008274 [Wickerhamomyces pijperi]
MPLLAWAMATWSFVLSTARYIACRTLLPIIEYPNLVFGTMDNRQASDPSSKRTGSVSFTSWNTWAKKFETGTFTVTLPNWKPKEAPNCPTEHLTNQLFD